MDKLTIYGFNPIGSSGAIPLMILLDFHENDDGVKNKHKDLEVQGVDNAHQLSVPKCTYRQLYDKYKVCYYDKW